MFRILIIRLGEQDKEEGDGPAAAREGASEALLRSQSFPVKRSHLIT